ncbi:MAG: flagellar motor protein [Vibrio sp.]
MSFIGVFVALAFIIGANLLEGGHPSALLNLPAFLIVLGGSLGAILVQFPFTAIKATTQRFVWLIIPPRPTSETMAYQLLNLCNIARKDGYMALEAEMENQTDPILIEGVNLMVDGVDKDKIDDILRNRIDHEQHDIEQSAKIYEAMGGYSPTMGILGAVLGLIHAMTLLDQPDKLGPGIAVAFVATIYGVGMANLIFLPFGNRYKAFAHQLYQHQAMVKDALFAINSGCNRYELQRLLTSYLPNLNPEGNNGQK